MLSVNVSVAQNSDESKSPEAGNAYNDGLDQARKGNYKAAAALFEKAIKADPEFAKAYYMLGYSQKKLNQKSQAMNSYKKAIEVNKKFENAYIALGNLQTSMEDYESAINSYNAVLAFNEKSAKAHFGAGNVFYKQKNYEKAVQRLKQSVAINPSYDRAWNELGICQEQLNQLSEAVESFKKALENTNRASEKGNYYFRLGNAYLKLKKYNDAEGAFLNAVKLSKSQTIDGGSNFGLGEVYKNLGQKQKAIQYYEKAAKVRAWKASADYEIDLLKNPDKYIN
jgi:superkiller protein 3